MKKFFYLMFLGKSFFMMFLTSFPNNMAFFYVIVFCTAILNFYAFLYCNARVSGLDSAVVGIALACFASEASDFGHVG